MKNKKTTIAGIILVILCILSGIIYFTAKPGTQSGNKNITIVVTHGNQSENTFEYDTDEEYLSGILLEKELAEGEEGPYGLFIKTVDGETADDSKQQWWCITQNGEMVNTSADQSPLTDGCQYELTLKEGY